MDDTSASNLTRIAYLALQTLAVIFPAIIIAYFYWAMFHMPHQTVRQIGALGAGYVFVTTVALQIFGPIYLAMTRPSEADADSNRVCPYQRGKKVVFLNKWERHLVDGHLMWLAFPSLAVWFLFDIIFS